MFWLVFVWLLVVDGGVVVVEVGLDVVYVILVD